MVTFKVNDVHPERSSELSSISGERKAISLAGGNVVEGFSHRDCTSFVKGNHGLFTMNPLIQAVHLAFSLHLPLKLTPDVVWNTILQGVSEHVNKHPEKHRHAFVTHTEHLSVCCDSFRKDSPDNNWSDLVHQLADLIAENLSGKTALAALRTRFTTTDDTARVAHAAVFMDITKSYFACRLQTSCGIPSIQLAGTKEDWQQLRAALALLDDLELARWRARLDSILVHFEDAFDNRVEQSFWNDIFLKHGARRSGGVTTVSGWIAALFLYTSEGLNPSALSACEVRLNPISFHTGLRQTPFTWEYFGNEIKMLLHGGFVGVVVDPVTVLVEPQLGWLVSEAEPRSGICQF